MVSCIHEHACRASVRSACRAYVRVRTRACARTAPVWCQSRALSGLCLANGLAFTWAHHPVLRARPWHRPCAGAMQLTSVGGSVDALFTSGGRGGTYQQAVPCVLWHSLSAAMHASPHGFDLVQVGLHLLFIAHAVPCTLWHSLSAAMHASPHGFELAPLQVRPHPFALAGQQWHVYGDE